MLNSIFRKAGKYLMGPPARSRRSTKPAQKDAWDSGRQLASRHLRKPFLTRN